MNNIEQEQDFLVLGVAILIIGALFVFTVYMSFPQTTEWTVDYSFPESDFEAQGKHYSVAEAYSMFYSSRDVVLIMDYSAPYCDHITSYGGDCISIFVPDYNRTLEAEMQVIFVNGYNQVLEVKHLDIDNMPWPFVSSYQGKIKIYLASPLPLEELAQKGCYGNWNVTFRQYHYPNLLEIYPHTHRGQFILYSVLSIGLIAIVTGVALTKLSMRKEA